MSLLRVSLLALGCCDLGLALRTPHDWFDIVLIAAGSAAVTVACRWGGVA